jgi:hypothetical protein
MVPSPAELTRAERFSPRLDVSAAIPTEFDAGLPAATADFRTAGAAL